MIKGNIDKYKRLLLSVSSGSLLFLAWPVSPLTLLIFVSWVPLLWLEAMGMSRRRFFVYAYITMLIWNVSTTWWVWNASAPGALAAFLANSLLMCLPWLGYKIAKNRLGRRWGYVALIAFWMCFEYLHLKDWGLSWPWLTLGNVFASNADWVQWYEFTGISGGTLWVLVINVLLFEWLYYSPTNFKKRWPLNWAITLLIAPIVFSFLLSIHMVVPQRTDNIVVVQPNIDPYEKVSGMAGSFEGQLQRLINTTEKKIDGNTRLVLWPETAMYMGNGINEEELKPGQNFLLKPLWDFLTKYPKMKLFSGIESFKWLKKPTKYSREYNGQYYESYNAAVVLDTSGALSFYHKSMLVPGVETLPWFLKFIDSWFEKFGGTTAGYARQEKRTVLSTGEYKVAPSICYESIYGDYMRQYVKNGADIICIITNDGWWKNTPGHKQHMNYARLRAIENRVWVARSANTGISCFISPYGKVIEAQAYDTNAAIKYTINPPRESKTFFAKYGDLLSKLMMVVSGVIFVMTGWRKWGVRNGK